MKRKNIEIERWDMDEFIEALAEQVSTRISVEVNCDDLTEQLSSGNQWLTTEEVLSCLQISRPTLDGMRRRGEMKYMRVGRGYRYQI